MAEEHSAGVRAPLRREDGDGIATLLLDRPEAYNALSVGLMEALLAELDRIADDASTRVVVIAGAGRGFCAGHDLRELRANPDLDFYKHVFGLCSRLMQRIVSLPKPVIARVHGVATAAGCQLVASCDLAIAAASARFATSGINYGLFCATPAVALSRNVSRKHALEMLFTGDFVDAATAAQIGLVNRAVDDAALDAEVDALARKIAAKSGYAIKLGKASFYAQANQPLDAAYRCASADLVRNLLAEDGIEGVNAFFEKREPRYHQ
jgi:enoyl-CoA hydratase/carnithine racemase